MNTYDYYTMDYNRLEKRFREQNKFNTWLELKPEITRAQFENVSDYLNKKSCMIKRLEMVINRLTAAKTKTVTILLSVEI